MAGLNKRLEGELGQILGKKGVRLPTPASRFREDLQFLRNFVKHEGESFWSRARGNRLTQADVIVTTAAFLVGEAVLNRLPYPGVRVIHRRKS